jgi:hypothetical protein
LNIGNGLSFDTNTGVLTATGTAVNITGTNQGAACGTYPTYEPFATVTGGTALSFNRLCFGNGLSLTGNVLSATGTSVNVTGSNASNCSSSNGEYLPFASANGTSLTFNKLCAGTNIIITNGNTISSTATAGGVTVTNVGSGTAIYSGTTGSTVSSLSFKSLAAGTGVGISESSGTVTISASSASIPKFPLIYPFEVTKSCTNGDCTVTGGGTDDSKATAMAFFQTTYGVTDTNVANYNWFIAGGLFSVRNTGSAASIRNFMMDVRISGDAFVIDWQFKCEGTYGYNLKWKGMAIAVHK